MSGDAAFAGSIPQIYEDCLVPVIFEPYAEDLAARAKALGPADVLEIAAGTGVVTRRLAVALPGARIVATDLNPAMLAVAQGRGASGSVVWQPADAQALPFADASFDLVLAQFGAMFYPDRVGAYREARRVLRAGGTWLFNVWDRLEANPGSAAIHRALLDAVPDPKPGFLARTPFGYNDRATIEAELGEAGFSEVSIEQVVRTSPVTDAARLARGLCLGSPLANELAAHPPAVQAGALAAAIAAAEAVASGAGLAMSALVITAQP